MLHISASNEDQFDCFFPGDFSFSIQRFTKYVFALRKLNQRKKYYDSFQHFLTHCLARRGVRLKTDELDEAFQNAMYNLDENQIITLSSMMNALFRPPCLTKTGLLHEKEKIMRYYVIRRFDGNSAFVAVESFDNYFYCSFETS